MLYLAVLCRLEATGHGPLTDVIDVLVAVGKAAQVTPQPCLLLEEHLQQPSSLSDLAAGAAKTDRVLGRLGLGQEPVPVGDGFCGASLD